MRNPRRNSIAGQQPQPLDLSNCQDVGGWHVCPHTAPRVILSDEQIQALKKTRALTAAVTAAARKTAQPKPLDLSNGQTVGGWHVVPHAAPGVVLSDKQFQALKKTRAGTTKQTAAARKAVQPEPLDLSDDQDVGGWHVVAHASPSVILSDKQFQALKKTRALTARDVAAVRKALKAAPAGSKK